jgi:glycine dehydrogenase
MIPLGSCTMKLNAAAEMEPITWPEFAVSTRSRRLGQPGPAQVIADLEDWLCEITGYDRLVAAQRRFPGRVAGLLAIPAYHAQRGEPQRDRLPDPVESRTAPTRRRAVDGRHAGRRGAPAATNGDVDLDDLRAKIAEHADASAALMITYPVDPRGVRARRPDICAACTSAAARSTSTAPTSTRWSGWPGRDVRRRRQST